MHINMTPMITPTDIWKKRIISAVFLTFICLISMIQFLLENLQEQQLSKDCSSDICIDARVFLILWGFFLFVCSKNAVMYSTCLPELALKYSLMPLFNLQILEHKQTWFNHFMFYFKRMNIHSCMCMQLRLSVDV